MIEIGIIFLILILWAVKELIVGIWVNRERKAIRHLIRVQRSQHHFAEARNELMKLALKNQIDVNSATFRSLYGLNTAVMRWPDAHEELSVIFRYLALTQLKSDPDNPMIRESSHWSEEIKNVVRMTAEAMDYLIVDYSRILRLFYRAEKFFYPEATPHSMLRRLLKKAEEREVKKNPVVSDIRKTQSRFRRLAGLSIA